MKKYKMDAANIQRTCSIDSVFFFKKKQTTLQEFGEKGAHLVVCSRCLSRLLQYTLRSPALTVALHRSSRHQHAQCSLAYSLSPPDAGPIRTYQEMKFLYTHYNYINL
jgi:hypothetical protein